MAITLPAGTRTRSRPGGPIRPARPPARQDGCRQCRGYSWYLHRGPVCAGDAPRALPRRPRTLALMEAFMDQPGLVPNGLYHELYLSDMRETAPQKMRTILRQPARAA